MHYKVYVLGLALTCCYGGRQMKAEKLVGRYHISASYFLKWGKRVDVDISMNAASVSIYNIFTKETSFDTLDFIRSDEGDLIRLEGKTVTIKRTFKTRIFIREKEHGIVREDALETFRVKEPEPLP